MLEEAIITQKITFPLVRADWIGGKGSNFCRKVFFLKEAAVLGKLHIVADAYMYQESQMLSDSFLKYRLFLNGKQFGVGPFRPVIDKKVVLHKFDVSNLLKQGINVFGVISRGNSKGFALLLEIKLKLGKTLFLTSNNRWKQLNGEPIYNHFASSEIRRYGTGKNGPGEYKEHIVGEKYPTGWLNPEYNDSNWSSAKTYGKCHEKFEKWDGVNYELKSIFPKKLKKINNGHFFIDFGHELIAGIELDAPIESGKVEIRLGEELDYNGRVRYDMRTGNHYQTVWSFSDDNDCLANFSLHAFRYAEIIGWQGELQAKNIRAVNITMPFDEDNSTFLVSNKALEKVWKFCRNTIKYTSMDVYQDCPSRERIAYEADTYINMLSHFAVESDFRLAKRIFEYQLQHPTWPCEWRQLMIPIAYEYLMHTGDCDLIDHYFEFLRDNCSFHKLINDGLIKKFPMRIIIDWPKYYRDNYEIGDNCTVPNAYTYYDLVLLARLSKLLDRSDCEIYIELAQKIKNAFNEHLYDAKRSLYTDGISSNNCSFHANMFALRFGLVPEERIKACLDFIERKGMVCSVYAAQFYLETLFKYDRAKTAVKLMTSEDSHSSWLGMIKQGATATMEAWHTDHKPNLSWAHPWATAPLNIIPRHLFGLYPEVPGWKKFKYNPKPGGLKSGSITIPTPAGRITATFKEKNGNYDYSAYLH